MAVINMSKISISNVGHRSRDHTLLGEFSMIMLTSSSVTMKGRQSRGGGISRLICVMCKLSVCMQSLSDITFYLFLLFYEVGTTHVFAAHS